MGGKKYPQTDLVTAVFEPLGVNRNALVTFPKYDGATKWNIFATKLPPKIPKWRPPNRR